MNDWELWQQQALEKQGPTYPVRLSLMHKMYGVSQGHTCKNCRFLDRVQYAGTYLKCDKSRRSRCSATDWRAGWPACGLYEEEGEGMK